MSLLQTFLQLIVVSGNYILQDDPKIRLIGICVCMGFFAGPLFRLGELLESASVNTKEISPTGLRLPR